MRLIFSRDDGGWYWERRDWKRSQVFKSEAAARTALKAGECVWED